jgi:hypothetical protein
MMQTTVVGTHTRTDMVEDSALLAALADPAGQIHAPDRGRLASLGLVAVTPSKYDILTEDGRAIAEALRARERDFITDDMLDVILTHVPRLTFAHEGWIAGATWYEKRPYIELRQAPGGSVLGDRNVLEAVASQLRDRLGIYSEIEDDNRLLFGALRPSRRGSTPRLGESDRAREDRIEAAFHADAVWTDLCSDHHPSVHPVYAPGDGPADAPMGFSFHYYSRTVLLSLDDNGRYRADTQFTVPRPDGDGADLVAKSWTGHRADVAVKNMARSMYGTPCADGYGTGRDSCPGCDKTEEDFRDQHEGELSTMPGSVLSMTRVLIDTAASPLNVLSKIRPES